MMLRLRSYTSLKFSSFFKVISIVAITTFGTLVTILFIRLIDESILLKNLSIISAVVLLITFLLASLIKKSSRRFVDDGFITLEDDSIEITIGDTKSRIELKEITSITVFKESYDGETEANWALWGIVTLDGLGNSLSIVTTKNKFRFKFYAESKIQLRSLALLLSEWKSKYEIKVRYTDKRSKDLLHTTIY